MKIAQLTQTEEIEIKSRDRPEPSESEVVVEVSNVGICGSDVHWYSHGGMGNRVVTDPLILGHESAGHVVEVGQDVTGITVGEEVAIEPGVPCRQCEYCRKGQYNLCPDVEFMATPGVDGAFREYVAWPADFVHRLPHSVSTRVGALCEPISVGIQAVQRADIDVDDTVLIMGAGAIGTYTQAVAEVAGAGSIIVADVVPSKLDRAKERGAELTINSSERNVKERISDELDEEIDVAIDATGAPSAIESVLNAPRPNGTAVLVGLAPDSTIPLNTFEIIRHQIDIRGSYRFANTYSTAISLLATNRIDAMSTIDFEMSLDRIGDAFERAREPDTVKGMISTS